MEGLYVFLHTSANRGNNCASLVTLHYYFYLHLPLKVVRVESCLSVVFVLFKQNLPILTLFWGQNGLR